MDFAKIAANPKPVRVFWMPEFGVVIPTFPFDDSDERAFVSQLTNFIAGMGEPFESVWTGDHMIPWAKSMVQKPMIEAFAAISFLAGAFPRLKFGNVVLANTFRNPALLARMGATLQMLTGGRYVLGIGAGSTEKESRAYGYDFPNVGARLGHLEEAVQIVRTMWTDGTASFSGKHYRVENAICQPVPKPRPPIMIGGPGEREIPRLVAKYADWYNLPNVPTRDYRRKLETLKRICEAEKRDYEKIRKTLVSFVGISKDRIVAREIVAATPYENPAAEENFLIGTPRDVASRIVEYMDVGVDLFMLRFLDFPRLEGARLFVNEVIPALRRRRD